MNNKTIILSSENKTPNGIKAILTLITDNSTLKGKMRLYNANTLPLDSKIGVYYKEKIHTATITKSQDTYNFEINQNFDLTNDIYCAVLDKKIYLFLVEAMEICFLMKTLYFMGTQAQLKM